MKILLRKFLLMAFSFSAWMVFGHDIPVHEAITVHAAASAFRDSSAYAEFVETISTDLPLIDATNSMVKGSALEDALANADRIGGFRSLNHFYDPLTGLGLSNIPLDNRLIDSFTGLIMPVGNDSFTWASMRDFPGVDVRVVGIGVNVNTRNIWSWQNARDHEWDGLTNSSPAARRQSLSDMFRAVGQVVHLLEDTSQPEHTRNEQHLFPGSPIEKFGGSNLTNLNYQDSMLDWRGAGFTKLEDFWNRHLYEGDAAALTAEASGGAMLGLAEFSNGNFLGARHLFPEYFTPGHVEYYPFPSRDHSTDYADVKAHPAAHISNYTLKNGTPAKSIYLAKTGDGITFDHLARVNYLGVKISGLSGTPSATPYCTIADDNVLKDYHDILIPKAIEYSAGLLDYYFRGQLDVCVGLETAPGTNLLRVINRSGTNLLGGTFTVLSDAGGVRNQIASNNLTGRLEDGSAMTLTFPTNAGASSYLVVYQGTIGSDGTTPLDPVDAGIAIAAKRFTIPSTTDEEISSNEWVNGTWITNGQVVAVADPDSRDEKPAGRYRVRYLGGHATATRTFQFGSTQCTATKFYTYLVGTTNSWHNGALSWYGDPVTGWFDDPVNNSHQLCWNGGKGGSTMTCADGTGGQECWFAYDNASDVEQATSTNAVEFCHSGGKFGPVVGRVDSNCVMNLDTSFSPGNITFAVERLTFPQIETNAGITSLTVNLDTNIISQLLPCADCPTNSTSPIWSGELNFLDSGSCHGDITWYNADPAADSTGASLNGFEVFAAVYAASDLPTQNGVGWRLAIMCKISANNKIRVWEGTKSKGYGPGGTYTFDTSYVGCANNNVCCITVQENR